jgi:hypothetical protein
MQAGTLMSVWAEMTDPKGSRLDLKQVLVLFPEQAPLVKRLAMESEAFRSICEDYALASSTLARLSAAGDAERNATVLSDYLLLVADLERDIAAALRSASEAG